MRSNSRKIRQQIMQVYLLNGLEAGCLIGIVILLYALELPSWFQQDYRILAIVMAVVSVVVGLLFGRSKWAGLKRRLFRAQAGHEDSFDDEEFRMVDHSGTLYTGGAWLLYREGLDCRIYYRNSIESIDPYGEHGGKRVKVWLSVKLQNRQDLEVLGYEAGNPDAADLLAEWLNPVPQKKVCRACGAPNDPGAKYCAWCGSPLD